MRIPIVYADTSVCGGVFDEEFRVPSTRFFDQVRAGRFVLVVSSLVQQEMQDAPAAVRELLETVVTAAERVDVSDEDEDEDV